MMMRSSTLLQPIYSLIDADLRQVEALFDQELRCDLPFVDGLCTHIRRYRGKMLRPTLVLLSGSACGGIRREHITVAAVLEMVHMATLVHDDVLDEADVRRRQPTVNHMTSNETAVLLGDYLISHAYHLCSSLESCYAARTVASCTNTVCEGELLQVSHRDDWDLTLDDYFTIISRKTGALTSVATMLGAKYAGANAQIQSALESYGLDAGIAFQIVDDILDLTASAAEVGKSVGRDLAKGKLTLPVIHFLRHGPASDVATFRAQVERCGYADPAATADWLADGIAYAMDCARQRVRAAVNSLEVLPASPAGTALRHMAEFILQRRN